ncbi:hypothetical protein JCM8097_006287 [Rhodosporidiobolus ruineniae]
MPPRPPEPAHHTLNLLGQPRFRNPWPSAARPPLSEWVFKPWLEWYDADKLLQTGIEDVRVVKPDWGERELRRRRRKERERWMPPPVSALQGGKGAEREKEYVTGTWLGHAGAYATIPLSPPAFSSSASSSASSSTSPAASEADKLHLLFDPIFSPRAGPTSWLGPKRAKDPPCEVEDLPGVDLVFISHNHYDHLDRETIERVLKTWPKARYFVPLGNKPWFTSLGISSHRVFELDWWDEVDLTHTSGRGIFDQRATLWTGWLVERLVPLPADFDPPSSRTKRSHSSDSSAISSAPSGASSEPGSPTSYLDWARRPLRRGGEGEDEPLLPTLVAADEGAGPPAPQSSSWRSGARRWVRKGAVFHAGDTGYRPLASSPAVNPAFAALGAHYGPLDLSFVPIWRGGTLGFLSGLGLRLCHENLPSATHGSPGDGIDIHLAVRSRNTVAVHFGTFRGSPLETLEALAGLDDAKMAAGVGDLRRVGSKSERGREGRGRMGAVDIGETVVVQGAFFGSLFTTKNVD